MTGIAILGAGAIAGYHLRASRDLPDARVTWVADLDRGKAEALAASCGARATADPAEAVAAPDVAAAIVAVPTPAHRALVELAAAHGHSCR